MLKVLHEQNAAEATANRAERDSLRGDVGTHRDRIEQLLREAAKAESMIEDLEANLKNARRARDELEALHRREAGAKQGAAEELRREWEAQVSELCSYGLYSYGILVMAY